MNEADSSGRLSVAEAKALQRAMAKQVDVSQPLTSWSTIAAADVSFNRGDDRLFAAVVVVDASTLNLVDQAGIIEQANWPYIPGLLSFREAPAILKAFDALRSTPDVLICDGHGLAHPRRLGIACHIGLQLDLPTLGCAKKKLCGTFETPGPNPGDSTPLYLEDDQIGVVLRTRLRSNPVFISPGHRIDLASSVRVVASALEKYRLPVPIRLAHLLVNQLRRDGHVAGRSEG